VEKPVRDVLSKLTKAAIENRISFPGLVETLLKNGVQGFSANLISGCNTLYMHDESHHVVSGYRAAPPAPVFRAERVLQSFRLTQNGELNYSDFCKLLAQAGCVEFTIKISARHTSFRGNGKDYTVIWYQGMPA